MENIYYNGSELLSKNRLMNFIIGNRGGGKSFYWKRKCVENFLKKGEQFMWIRRYNSELDEIKTWADDIKYLFEGVKFEINKKHIKINGEIAGFIGALSTSQRLKSVPYPKCTLIVFDEFLIDKGSLRYIKGEAELCLELIETVFRQRDTNERMVFIGNAISVVNPYFTYFNIKPKLPNRFTLLDDFCIEWYSNEEFIKLKKNTRFGRLISNTKYGDYAIENKFLRDDYSFITPRPCTNLKYENTILYEGESYGVWSFYQDSITECLYIDKIVEKSCDRVISVKLEDLRENTRTNKHISLRPYILQLKVHFNAGEIYFNNIETKYKMFEVIKVL